MFQFVSENLPCVIGVGGLIVLVFIGMIVSAIRSAQAENRTVMSTEFDATHKRSNEETTVEEYADENEERTCKITLRKADGTTINIVCTDYDEVDTNGTTVSFEWYLLGMVRVFAQDGTLIEEFDSDEATKIRGWSDIVEWIAINTEYEPGDGTDLEPNWEPEETITIELVDGQIVTIEADDHDDLTQTQGQILLQYSGFGYIRVTRAEEISVLDTDACHIMMSFSNIKSWKLD